MRKTGKTEDFRPYRPDGTSVYMHGILGKLRQVPITKIDRKNINEMLDIRLKIGHLRVLTSVDRHTKWSSLFPNTHLLCQVHGTQCSNTTVYSSAPVPFGSWNVVVGEGREKERRTFQRYASPIAQLLCLLYVVKTFVPTIVSHTSIWCRNY
jgi:hypothetical protein